MSDQRPPGAEEPPDEPTPHDPLGPYGGRAERARPGRPSTPGPPVAPSGRNDRWQTWLGIFLAVPLLVATTAAATAAGSIDDSGSLSGIVGFAGFLTPIALLFPEATHKVAVGMLIGYAVLLVVGAGACIALLASVGPG